MDQATIVLRQPFAKPSNKPSVKPSSKPSSKSSNKSSSTRTVLADRYLLLDKIGSGGNGVVHDAYDRKTETDVCIKVAEITKHHAKPLSTEAHLLKFFNNHTKDNKKELIRTPRYITLIRTKHTSYLVMEKLGKSTIELARATQHGTFNLHDICMLGSLMVCYLRRLHGHAILHRDLKPQNILFGLKHRIPYLIDFGLSTKYKNHGHHYKFDRDKRVGTCKYMSPHAHLQQRQSRRDDMISLGYVLIYLFLGELPWKKHCHKLHVSDQEELSQRTVDRRLHRKKDNRHVVLRTKKLEMHNHLMYTLPKCLQRYFKLVWDLKFDEQPDYTELKKCFLLCLKANNEQFDYDWSWLT